MYLRLRPELTKKLRCETTKETDDAACYRNSGPTNTVKDKER